MWFEMGRTNVILDNLLANGKVKPMLVVMETSATGAPDSPGGRPGMEGVPPAGGVGRGRAGSGAGAPGAPGAGRGPAGPPGGPYGQIMINDLIPWVDRHFRTLADKDHRAMAGLSMGGGQTATITMVNLDKFSYIGLFSGGAAIGFGGRGRGRRRAGCSGANPRSAGPQDHL